MSMKIGSTPDTHITADLGVRGAARQAGAAGTATVAGTPAIATATDKVEVSAAAAQMRSSTADFDSAKVDAIRQAIREGRFKVNPDAIADKLIESASEMLGSRIPS